VHEPAWPIETARLLLRPFLASDLEALHAIQGDEENARWLYNARTLAETRELLALKTAGRGEWQSELVYAIRAREWRAGSGGAERDDDRY